ncbi:formate/nitrite transporter family protein [Fulvimarina endophytica]|uniref:formate/nitrite transporter family protein n=1 Tax=Fulvimarina endophytica TaxID=2293836 RepID=UPI0018F5CC7E|nr:formate/nitrite transporter family protein [Fulvimarina endophytica]
MRERDSAASGAPAAGWATGDRFSWEEIHQRLLASADEEIAERTRVLIFSGLTAGFAITLTFLGLTAGLAAFPNNPFLAALLYPIGFLYIVLGRYQLYTENTLSPVKLVLTRLASLPLLLRLWAIVLASNILGAMIGAYILSEAAVVSGGRG